jgi:hypothetical protein
MEHELEYYDDPMFKNGRIALLEKVLENLILASKNKSESVMLVNSFLVEFTKSISEDEDIPEEWKGGVDEGVSQIQLMLKKQQPDTSSK